MFLKINIKEKDIAQNNKDTGNIIYDTGAVRESREGKGRCDLIPLDIASKVLGGKEDFFLEELEVFKKTGDFERLVSIARYLAKQLFGNDETALLEYALHLEEGAKKYGDSNWMKGLPVSRYVDSAVRHYIKFLRCDKDERHDRAAYWNIIGALWTCIHKPELNDYPVDFK